MRVKAYIHSLQDKENNRHVLDDAEIIREIGDNKYLAKYNGTYCTAIFNYYTGSYYIDDVYGIVSEEKLSELGYRNL